MKEKTERQQTNWRLSPAIVRQIRVQAAMEDTKPGRIVEKAFAVYLESRSPAPKQSVA